MQSTHIRYVILNGPPSAGKTSLAKELCSKLNEDDRIERRQLPTAYVDSFAAPLRHFFAVALGDRFRHMLKDEQRPELSGYTLRQCYIDLAETYIKGRFGEDIFAKWLVHRSLRYPHNKPLYVIIDDGGFRPEIEAVPNRFIVAIYRKDKTFKDDSRSYYMPPNELVHNDCPSLAGLWKIAEQLSVKVLNWEKWQ